MNKNFKIALRLIIGIFACIILLLLTYVVYISIQYYRIEDLKDYTKMVQQNQNETVTLNTSYGITTYNIGFGAYNHDFSFFMDSGTMKNGKKVSGTGSRADCEQTVIQNTTGAMQTIQALQPDFCFFQEVDTAASRSYQVNQFEMLCQSFVDMANVHVSNFHSAYLFYPLLNPHGQVNSGIATFSSYQVKQVVRHSLEISDAFPTKFFDLDRCFSATYIATETAHDLVIVNVHLSAYDEGGVYRKKQWETLNAFLDEEYQKGNYVICGGDFNHDIADSVGLFETTQEKPDWVYVLSENDLTDHYTFATSNQIPTCRSTDMPYQKGENYTVVLDGFIVSDNIMVEEITNIDTDFLYSDHNPVYMKFQLKG